MTAPREPLPSVEEFREALVTGCFDEGPDGTAMYDKVLDSYQAALEENARLEARLGIEKAAEAFADAFIEEQTNQLVTEVASLQTKLDARTASEGRLRKERETLRTVVHAFMDHRKQHRDIAGECNVLNCTVFRAAQDVLHQAATPPEPDVAAWMALEAANETIVQWLADMRSGERVYVPRHLLVDWAPKFQAAYHAWKGER